MHVLMSGLGSSEHVLARSAPSQVQSLFALTSAIPGENSSLRWRTQERILYHGGRLSSGIAFVAAGKSCTLGWTEA